MIYEVVWSNGEQVSRQLVEQTEEAPVSKIVEYGTAATSVSRDDDLADIIQNEDGSGTLVFASGVTMKFSSTRAMTATGYTTGYDAFMCPSVYRTATPKTDFTNDRVYGVSFAAWYGTGLNQWRWATIGTVVDPSTSAYVGDSFLS